jgi:hypothetical protein
MKNQSTNYHTRKGIGRRVDKTHIQKWMDTVNYNNPENGFK